MVDSVKSARRVFEVLEHFARVQRPVSVAEIASAHGYPVSSVSALMRTMVALGYLAYDGSARTYLPTARLPFVVSWIGNRLYDGDSVRAIMLELSDATRETIILAAQNGIRAQYVEIVDATGPVRLHATTGSFRSMLHTAAGLALLSRLPDAQLGPLIRRINSEEPDPARRVDAARAHALVGQVRDDGHAFTVGGVVPGAGALAVLLPAEFGVTSLSLGIASVEPVLRNNRARFAGLLEAAIARHAGAATLRAQREAGRRDEA